MPKATTALSPCRHRSTSGALEPSYYTGGPPELFSVLDVYRVDAPTEFDDIGCPACDRRGGKKLYSGAERPFLLPGLGVQRVEEAVQARDIHDSIDDGPRTQFERMGGERCGFSTDGSVPRARRLGEGRLRYTSTQDRIFAPEPMASLVKSSGRPIDYNRVLPLAGARAVNTCCFLPLRGLFRREHPSVQWARIINTGEARSNVDRILTV